MNPNGLKFELRVAVEFGQIESSLGHGRNRQSGGNFRYN